MAKHRDDCLAPETDYAVECICPICELCGDPAQGKKEANGLDICDECWPHLETESQLLAGLDTLTQRQLI